MTDLTDFQRLVYEPQMELMADLRRLNRKLERELRDALRMVTAIVASAGGEVIVHDKTLRRGLILEREDDPVGKRTVFRATASKEDSRGRSEQFCGRDDLEPHHPHSWARLPDGSYGDYDDEERDIVWCGGSNQGARRGG